MLLVVLLAYLPALRGGLLWDDDAHVTKLPLRSLHGLWRIWFDVGATQQYYPLLHSAFWVEHRLWGDAVLGYHLANVAFHAAAAWLLVVILRRLAFPVPMLAGLLFALHPVCVESVAWISEQKNTLSTVFYLGAALVYLCYDETRSKGGYACASVLFVMALLTKSVTATLPAALLVVFWWRRGRIDWRRDVIPLLPWFVAGIAGGLFTAHVEVRMIGAQGVDFSLTFLQRLLIAGRAIAFYAGKVVWPSGLAFVYPRWQVNPRNGLLYLYPAAVLALLGALLVRARKQRGPLAGFLLFAGTLFPVLGFINVYPFIYSFVADHFQYLAILGIIVPIAWGLDRIASRIPMGPPGRACILIAVPAVLGFLSWRQCQFYRDADTLNRATLERNPSAWRAHYDLAVSLGRDPLRMSESISEYEAALRLNPRYWAAHSNLGSAYLEVIPGRTADAISEYEAALRLNPDFADAHSNLGVALGRTPGRLPEAIAHVRKALVIRPDDDGILDNLGALLMRQPGSMGEAITDFQAAIRISPGNPQYHYNLANALAENPGRLGDAVAEYRAALRLEPDFVEAHSNLGAALDRMPGPVPAAISEYESAVRLAPGNAHLHRNLANALAKVPARSADAISEYQAALRIDPSDAQAHNGLGILLSAVPGRMPEAASSEFETAVRLEPGFALAHYCLAIGLVRTGGSRDQAMEQLRIVLQIQPDFDLAQKALLKLEATNRNPH